MGAALVEGRKAGERRQQDSPFVVVAILALARQAFDTENEESQIVACGQRVWAELVLLLLLLLLLLRFSFSTITTAATACWLICFCGLNIGLTDTKVE